MVLTTYIVRVYKFKKNQPRNLVGLVEEVGAKGRRGFTNLEELWEILNSPIPTLSSLQGEGESSGGHMRKNRQEKRR